ncbi:DNA polymerase III subunit gamma/tau [Clostridium sp. C1]|uniref:DNA polymerase III subunit gamma/tau n=1 Tax=Clostridium sp. C1 TaxID=1155388 RepID=UPI001BAC4DAA|nr:DNA polymerase III subunit gamma/tau [Clostridium sp. C1]QUN12170.1 DNA polymerase III subunit gamma/tau [Clostridium sp. C1]
MAYKTLYRVYRPQRFEDVAGQEHIITTLKHAVEENKIAHAYLFCGPRGTGKTTIAKLLAKAVNCTGSPKPCDQCENCQQITLGTHPDVIEIDAASNNGVDEIRDLIEKVKYAPTQGKYKVYIVDEFHMMSPSASNALLKTLEEPPTHVIFIFATTEPHKILPTIISRCQRFDFTKLSVPDIVSRMEDILKEEHYQCDQEALELIAKLADGGMRDALSILEQCLAYNDKHLTVQDVNQIYGIVSLENKIDFIKMILSKDMKKALSTLEDMKMNGIDIKRLTLDLVDILKDIVIYRNTQDESILFVLSKYYLDLIVPYIGCEEALNFIDILMDASEKYAKVINPSVYFELAILKMCNQIQDEKIVHIETVKVPQQQVVETPVNPEVIEDEEIMDEPVQDIGEDVMEEEPYILQEVIEEVPTFEFEKEPDIQADVDNDIHVDEADIMNILVQAKRTILESIQERWPIIKRYLANLNMAKSAGMLCDGTAVAACEGGLIISFEYQPSVNAVNYYKNYKQLSAFLQEVLGSEYRFIAIQQDEWIKMRSHFIELKRQRQLPEPHELTLKHIDCHDLDHVDMTEAQEFAVQLFGEDIVEFKED